MLTTKEKPTYAHNKEKAKDISATWFTVSYSKMLMDNGNNMYLSTSNHHKRTWPVDQHLRWLSPDVCDMLFKLIYKVTTLLTLHPPFHLLQISTSLVHWGSCHAQQPCLVFKHYSMAGIIVLVFNTMASAKEQQSLKARMFCYCLGPLRFFIFLDTYLTAWDVKSLL